LKVNLLRNCTSIRQILERCATLRIKPNLKRALPSIGSEALSVGSLINLISAEAKRFGKFLQSLQEDPLEVMAGSGFEGAVPFDWGKRGAIKSQYNSILGGSLGEAANQQAIYERLEPPDLVDLIAKLKQYVEHLHTVGKVRRVMPYIDFRTQILGRH